LNPGNGPKRAADEKKYAVPAPGRGPGAETALFASTVPRGVSRRGSCFGESGTAPIYVYKMQYTKARTFALCRVPPVTHIWLFFNPGIWCMIKRNGPDGAG